MFDFDVRFQGIANGAKAELGDSAQIAVDERGVRIAGCRPDGRAVMYVYTRMDALAERTAAWLIEQYRMLFDHPMPEGEG